MIFRKVAAFLLLMAAADVFADDDAYRALIEKDRWETDEFLRSPQSPLLLVARYGVAEGTNILGATRPQPLFCRLKLLHTSGKRNIQASKSRALKAQIRKKPGPLVVPALSWLVARIKVYAVLRGRTVKSRTCVRMLDICIPFSCETNGRISAMNWSFTSSLISS